MMQDLLRRFDSLRPSQQFFSYVRTGLPGLNQYYKQRFMCLAQDTT